MGDPDIEGIFEEGMKEHELNHQIGKDFQFLVEEAIMNRAAIDSLNTANTLEKTLGNSQ